VLTTAIGFFPDRHGSGHSRGAAARARHLLDAELHPAESGSDVHHRSAVSDHVRAPLRSRPADGAEYGRGRLPAYGVAMLGYAWKRAERGPDGVPRWTAGIGVAFLPVLLMGTGALFPSQSWRVVSVEALASIAAVALMTRALHALTSVKVATKGLLLTAIPLISRLLSFVALVVHVKATERIPPQAWTQHSTEVLLGVGVARGSHRRNRERRTGVRHHGRRRIRRLVRPRGGALVEVAGHAPAKRWSRTTLDKRPEPARYPSGLAAQRTNVLSDLVRLIQSGNRQDAFVKLGTGIALMRRVPRGNGHVLHRRSASGYRAATGPERVMAAFELASGGWNHRLHSARRRPPRLPSFSGGVSPASENNSGTTR